MPKLLYSILVPFRYEPREEALEKMLFYGSGIAGGIICAMAGTGKKSFKLLTIVGCAGTTITGMTYAFMLFFERGHYHTVLIFALHGSFMMSLYAVVYEFAVELVPGVGESYSTGLINSLANFFACIQLLSFEAFDRSVPHPLFTSIFVLLIPLCVSLFCFCMVSTSVQSN